VARMTFFSVGGAEKPGITQNPKKTNTNASVQVIRFIIMLLQLRLYLFDPSNYSVPVYVSILSN
jgi:hypothetical protein